LNRINQVFDKLRQKGQKALIPYLSCGYPSLEFTEKAVPVLAKTGADLIELGVPYSDPVADGPTIQRASIKALSGGVTLEKIFSMAGRLRSKTDVPLIMMTYYNPVYVTGVETFIEKAVKNGIDGLIIPDLPVEEAGYLHKIMEGKHINSIFLVAPTSTAARIKQIAYLCRGFIYCVSVTGVTGARAIISDRLEGFITNIRRQTNLPVAVGFGISGPDTARQAARYADGVIVGSALIEKIEEGIAESGDFTQAIDAASAFIGDIKAKL